MNDILGRALCNYYHKQGNYKLWIHNTYGPKEEMPVSVYFRNEDDMPDIEWLAMNECRGRVLDIGAGAGSHSLLLQQRGIDITAIDISPLSVQVMINRGLKHVVEADIVNYNQGKFDTLLMLMNGVGLAATLEGLYQLLMNLKAMLLPGGQILLDSSDVAYVYEGSIPKEGYYGEILYSYEYDGQKSDWFKWLYIDEATLRGIASKAGFITDVLLEDEFGQYLARLT